MNNKRKKSNKKRSSSKRDQNNRDEAAAKVTKQFIEMRGTVEELMPAANFKIKLENGQTILGHLSGKMRMFRIRILPGDEVKLEMSPYDLTKGRIVYRY